MITGLLNNLKHESSLWETFIDKNTDAVSKCDERNKAKAMIPIVSEYLVKQGYTVSFPDNKKFAICLTHDVDDIYPPLSHRMLSALWCAKKLNLNGIKKQLYLGRHPSSPYINFQEIIELERKYNAKSTFYFMSTSLDPKRFRYNIEDIKDELKFINNSGWEVGLHGGYYSYNDIDAVKREKSRLENALGSEVIGYRNHYLKFQIPKTWDILEKCGFKYDSTYGFTNTIGFRNGMCHPFRPYNAKSGQWMGIYEIPLNVMESAMFGLADARKSWELVKELINQTELNKGVLTVLWHNNIFNCPFRKHWSELYERILHHGREKNAWMTSAQEILKWWVQNGY